MNKKCSCAMAFVALLSMGYFQASAQIPDHPIITEVFNNPSGLNDGPTGHDPTNPHQEFIEIYIPGPGDLSAALARDSVRLTIYEIQGNSGSAELGFVNQRYDLPAFDLDTSNGITALERPSSGLVVLGWVDYDFLDPPMALRGTPSTRVALINNEITTSPAGVLFIAINGAQFTGTTNFPVPVAESRIDIPNEHASGVMKNGSNAYLLVDRDATGGVSLDDRSTGSNAFADLPGGTSLPVASLLDGIAGNDDIAFRESLQPYMAGTNMDLADVLPLGGVFTPWVAQINEATGAGYARKFVDVLRTTEDGIGGNEDPGFDAINRYRNDFRTGPFYATPGTVVFTTSPPDLGVSLANRLDFEVLADTTGRPGLLCANVGGDYPINIAAAPGSSDLPTFVTFASSDSDLSVPGQSNGYPQIAVTVTANAPDGAIATAPVTFTASNSQGGDPAVVNSVQGSTTIATVLNPTKALDGSGSPIETTVFAAVQGFGADAGVVNEFLASDLSAFISANLGTAADDTLGNLADLQNPATNLEDILVVDPLRQSFPAEVDYINPPGAGGTDDLLTTLKTSAKVNSGSGAYSNSVDQNETALKALEFAIPETLTKNGSFSPSERLFFANAAGAVNDTRSGLNSVTTDRTFELALIDTNMKTLNAIESGDDDDFGLIVEVGQVLGGASVVPGEFVFLSYTGGLEGEDVDTVDVPGINATVAVLLDLDNLHDVLGVVSITRLFVIDADVGGTLNIMEVVSLNIAGCAATAVCGDGVVCPETETCDDGSTDECGSCNSTCNGPGNGLPCAAIPAVGEWGLGILVLLILASATIVLRPCHRRTT